VVPVCYGPSRAVGSSNYIEIGQSSNWLRTDRGASLNVGGSTQGEGLTALVNGWGLFLMLSVGHPVPDNWVATPPWGDDG
jgi:hypothetical protein